MIRIAAVAVIAALAAGCTTTQQQDFTPCVNALFAAHTSNVQALAAVAANDPNCRALGAAIIDQLISQVAPAQAAKGVR